MDRSAKTGHRFFKNDTWAHRQINLGSWQKIETPGTDMVYVYKATVSPTVHHIGANVQWPNRDFVGFVIKF